MRRLGLITTVMIFAVMPSAAAAPIKRKSCPPPHSYVTEADGTAAIYRTRAAGIVTLAACDYRKGRPFVLQSYYAEETEPTSTEELYPLALAGSMLVYDALKTGSDRYGDRYAPYASRVIVRNLSTERVLHRVPSSSYREPDQIGFGVPLATVAKPDGAVAWIAYSGNHGPPSYELWETDRTALALSRPAQTSGATPWPWLEGCCSGCRRGKHTRRVCSKASNGKRVVHAHKNQRWQQPGTDG